ncbi:GerAB/ArcD/ProY family transporter [Ureibacillus terrenus]|uniref:GerAB/ArcD/ProY family transporter n=2 Tax=Bacillati TaxID=1783272 RepID=A0A540V178_9BACL|nr:endospore germination permease [Ureibacillus terrenus]TQE90504.1 GerAB/ArcD/ProY family transporter [Ureibacillus terrenus]
MGNSCKISILHVIFLCLTSIGLKNHVTVISPILETAKRDGWISVILTGIIIFPWILWILYIQKKSRGQPLKDWLAQRAGKWGSKIILFSVIILAYLLAAFTLRETILWVTTSFLENTPVVLLIIIYTIACFLLASTNIQTIASVNANILFFVIIFGFYASFTNLQVKNHELMFPILEHGMGPVIKAMIFPASGFIELFLLLFLQHYFKQPLKWHHIGIIFFWFVGLTLGPLIGAIVEFGPDEAARQHFPAYEEWALVSIGRFIEHMDFLSVYQWLSGTFIRVGIILFIVCDILNYTGKPKKIWLHLMPPFLILNLSLLLMKDDLFLLLNNYYLLHFTFIFIFILSVVLIIIAFFDKKTAQQNMK